MRKMLKTILLMLAVSIIPVSAFDAKTEAAKMKASGQVMRIGKTRETGFYIICMKTVQVQNGNVAMAMEDAKMQARTEIAAFMSAKVSEVKKNKSVTMESVKGEDESFESVDVRQKFQKVEVEQLQRGVTVCATEQSGSSLTVYCILIENVIDASAKLEKSMKKMGPNTVQVSGIAYFGNGVSLAAAEKNALAEAQREAIAQVLGVSITSTTARQSAARESVDKNGNESFACDDTFKVKVFSSAAGFVESSRVVDKQVNAPIVTITIVAKVAKDKLISDYRSYLEQMGNPGFYVNPCTKDACSIADIYAGFFGELGLRMVDNLYDATYVLEVTCRFSKENDVLKASVLLTAKEKSTETILFSQANDPEAVTSSDFSETGKAAFSRKILNKMKPELHKKLNTFIGRANADGRPIQVKLCNYDSDYRDVAKIVEKALKMVPGVSNVRMQIKSSEVVYTMNYKNETEDLADFLEKQIKVDVKRRSRRPARGNVQNTLVEFNFE